MREEGVPYNTITYNSIIDVCIKCSDVQTAEELLREMLAPGSQLEPDLITYSTLLKGYCHVGDLDKALQVAETIKACGLKCDELVYNTLMDGCVKANDLSAGIGLFAEMTQGGMRPSSITHSILVRLYQRNGYKGDCFDAVGQLYQHHGLDRPSGPMERGGKGNNNKNDKRGDRKDRNNHQNNGRSDHSGGNHLLPNSGGNGGMNGGLNIGQGMDSIPGWDHLSMPYPGPLGHPGMPPPHMMGGYPGGIPPHPHLMGGPDPSLLASREGDMDPYGAHGGLPYGMSLEALQGRMSGGIDADRGMGLYLPPRNLPPPAGGLNGQFPYYGSASSSQLGHHQGAPMGASLALGQQAPMGADLRRYPPRGNSGIDPLLDPNLLPWGQGGIPDMPYPVSSAYLERMNGLPDGRPPLVGVQCGGPTEFEGY
jgi:pentatricopeptide repeat protein